MHCSQIVGRLRARSPFVAHETLAELVPNRETLAASSKEKTKDESQNGTARCGRFAFCPGTNVMINGWRLSVMGIGALT